MIYTVVNIPLMISASKTTFSHLKILSPEVTKNIKNLRKKFCEFPPWSQYYKINIKSSIK